MRCSILAIRSTWSFHSGSAYRPSVSPPPTAWPSIRLTRRSVELELLACGTKGPAQVMPPDGLDTGPFADRAHGDREIAIVADLARDARRQHPLATGVLLRFLIDLLAVLHVDQAYAASRHLGLEEPKRAFFRHSERLSFKSVMANGPIGNSWPPRFFASWMKTTFLSRSTQRSM